ncbi:hypothetical protein [uncultured Modestobacter sp.]|nr:hypothetical protein [uncultured Modestobacter sp.]
MTVVEVVKVYLRGGLEPPLNQADNATHPLHPFVRDARKRWRNAARGDA